MRCASEGGSEDVQYLLALLATDEQETVDARLAYANFCSDPQNMRGRAFWPAGGWRRPQWTAVGAVFALILLLSFAPARTWGQRFLQMLRVQKLAVIPIDAAALERAGIGQDREHALSRLISDSVVVTIKPGEPETVASTSDAAAKVGFPVRALASLGNPERVQVEAEGAFHMTLDTDRIRAVLDEAGRSDIQVPDSVNGGTVAVHVSKGVNVRYGDCSQTGRASHDESTCIVFLQIPSPTVSVPPTLNMAAVAEAALQLTGLSAAEARSFAQTVDWSSTLVIPVPQEGASTRTLSVDGVNGTLITLAGKENGPGRYVIAWVKNGIVYALDGKGSPDRALAAISDLSS